MTTPKDSFDDLQAALQAKLESDGTPINSEVVKDQFQKQPLGPRQTSGPGRRLPEAQLKRENKVTRLNTIIKATLSEQLPIFFEFPALAPAHSLRTMISSYLNAEFRARITTRLGRPTKDDSLIIVGVFFNGQVEKDWLEEYLNKEDK